MKTPGATTLSQTDAARNNAVGKSDRNDEPGVFLERLQSPTAQDIAAIGELWQKCGLTRPGHDAGRDIADCLNSGRGSVILARTAKDATIIGTVMAGHDGESGWVHYLAVSHDARGTGLGSGLLALAEDILAATGLVANKVTVTDPAVHDFYRKFGYEIIETAPHTKPQTSEIVNDFVVMRKRLKS
ncbi:GNAT family N-acetyltransferase [Thalassospira australica]|uniref:GNAT family N-acetyltransferase n=1 Tax=Thalassospira australica TaxID=1528106 RepID=UPI00384F90FA